MSMYPVWFHGLDGRYSLAWAILSRDSKPSPPSGPMYVGMRVTFTAVCLTRGCLHACRSDQAVAVSASPDMSAAPPKKKLSHEIRDDPVYVNVLGPTLLSFVA
jgi:hypothetical protein